MDASNAVATGSNLRGYVQLSAAGCGLVLDCTGGQLPRVVHWGADLGALSEAELAALATTGLPQKVSNALDDLVPVSVLPEPSVGWLGPTGLVGHRDGADFSTAFRVRSVRLPPGAHPVPHRLTVDAVDPGAELELVIEL